MADLFRTLIITTQDADAFRAIAASFGPACVGMWTTPLSASGTEPVTHFISSGYIPTEFASLLPVVTWELEENGTWVQTNAYPGDASAVVVYSQKAGLNYTETEIEEIFNQSDISEQNPAVAMDRLGLKIINSPEGV